MEWLFVFGGFLQAFVLFMAFREWHKEHIPMSDSEIQEMLEEYT